MQTETLTPEIGKRIKRMGMASWRGKMAANMRAGIDMVNKTEMESTLILTSPSTRAN